MNELNKSFLVASLLLLVVLGVVMAFGSFAAKKQADNVVGYGFPVQGEGGGSVPMSLNSFKLFDVDPYAENGTDGNIFCTNHGYNKCVMESTWFVWTYYNSVDASCTGLQQIQDGRVESVSCDVILNVGNNPCIRDLYPYLTEPRYGDSRTSWSPMR